MSNEVSIFQQNTNMQISNRFAGMVDDIGGDLSGGVSGTYAILSFKGSRFSVKWQGTTTPITNDAGDPIGSMEAVFVKANPYLTKQYYAHGYTEGDSSAPDCFSIDGKVPSESSPHKQHANCAACPMNAFTKINESTGKKTKACQDNRKMAVLPADDLENKMFGGPMLVRIPAASLKDLAIFGDTLKARGYSYNSVRVRIGFDLTVSYPKLVFKAIRPLTDDEAEQVLEWYNSDTVNKLLADFSDVAVPVAEAAAEEVFEQPPVVVAAPKPVAPAVPPPAATVTFGKKPAPSPTPAPAVRAPKALKVVPKAAAPAPVVEEVIAEEAAETVPGTLQDDIAAILGELNSIAGE